MRILPADSSKAIVWLIVAGVVVVGLTDWLQGQPPTGVISLGNVAGPAVFIASSFGVAAGALFVSERHDGEPAVTPWALIIGLAVVAALVADPTYAVMLLAVPLVHVGRRWPEPLRRRTVVFILILAVVLVALEDETLARGNIETIMVLLLALLITSMLGHALGRLDEARSRESEVARRDEREQLAGELHDSVGHNLLATSIQLRNAQALWTADSEGAQRSLDLAKRAVDDALVDTRIAVDSVRSRNERFSLAAALPELIERLASPSLDVELALDGPVDSVEQLTQITLYRVVQEMIRKGLASLASLADDIEVVATGADGNEAVALAQQYRPNVVLMDIRMPGLDGIEATEQIRAFDDSVAVLMLTTFEERELVQRAFAAGAAGYLTKDIAADDLAAAIRSAAAGVVQLTPEATRMLSEPATAPKSSPTEDMPPLPVGFDGLTPREHDVLRLVAKGKNNQAIGNELHLSAGTVKNHVSAILRRLGTSDRTEAAVLATKHGLI